MPILQSNFLQLKKTIFNLQRCIQVEIDPAEILPPEGMRLWAHSRATSASNILN